MNNIQPFSLREFLSVVNNRSLLEASLNIHNMRMKEDESKDFSLLSNLLLTDIEDDIDGWYFDTDISIVPDFDAVLFCEDLILNIDLKHKHYVGVEEKVKNKFNSQKRILALLGRKYLNIVFYADNEEICLFKDNDFSSMHIKDLASLIMKHDVIFDNLIYDIKSSDYIISPLNNVEEYLNGEYCLTSEQKDIAKKLQLPGLYGVEGEAGTGKTLVAFDLVRKSTKKVLFIFSGKIKNGHRNIENKIENLTIVSAKDSLQYNLDNYDLVIVDEAQRLYSDERAYIYRWGKRNYLSKTTIFFYHTKQSLSKKDSAGATDSLCKTFAKDKLGDSFKLSKKIRSNPLITAFTDNLFELKKCPPSDITISDIKEAVQIKFFKSAKEAKPWIKSLQKDGYVFLIPTGDSYGPASSDQFINEFPEAKNTHEVLGSEEKSVVTYIDESVKYSRQGILQKNSSEYYFNDNELYVNMTRAEEKLAIAVIGNEDVFYAINDVILNPNSTIRVNQEIERLPLCKDVKQKIKQLLKRSRNCN